MPLTYLSEHLGQNISDKYRLSQRGVGKSLI